MDKILPLTLLPSWFLPTVLIALTLPCIFIYTIRRKISTMAARKLPPGPRGIPIIGNIHQVLAGECLYKTLWNLSQKYGPAMLLHFGSQQILVISSSEMASQVLKTNDHEMSMRPQSKAAKRISYNYSDVSFAPSNDHWRDMRKILVSELLVGKRNKLFKKKLEIEMEGFVRSLLSQPSGTIVNLDDALYSLLGEATCMVAFGKSYRGTTFNGKNLKEISDETIVMLGGSLSDYFPIVGPILDELRGWNRRLEKSFSDADGFLQMVIDEHLEHKASKKNDDEKDFVDDCISRLTHDEIKAILMNVLNGAIDTSSTTTVWAMSEIVKIPRIMEKLQKEIRSCVGRKSKVHESDIAKMTYLKMVVKETLRLHTPSAFLIGRECVSHCQVGGYDVYPGTKILVNVWGIGRDSRTWKERPNEFWPERFESFKFDFLGKHCEMVPFGGGKRACPGYNSGIANVEFILANLLYMFDWEAPGGVRNQDLDMEEYGFWHVDRKTPLCLVPKEHQWQD